MSDRDFAKALTEAVEDYHDPVCRENDRLRRLGRDVLDAWRSGESSTNYAELCTRAIRVFGGRQ